MRILIVEDEDDTRGPFVNILKRRGHTMFEAITGRGAIETIEKEKPDLVILDISLKDEITGMDVLKDTKPKFPEIEIVMMSAYESEYKAESLKIGAYGFIKKPITSVQDILNAVEEIKKKKGLQ